MFNLAYKKVYKHGACYRLTIPPDIRRALNIKVGDYMKMYVQGNKLIMEKVTPDFDERRLK